MDEPQTLISQEDIDARVGELAAQISADYAGKGELVLIGVLKGAFIFLADLSRRLTIPRTIEFIAVSSYATGSIASGAVRVHLPEGSVRWSPVMSTATCRVVPFAWLWMSAPVSRAGTY